MIKDNGNRPKGITMGEEIPFTKEFKDFYNRIYEGLEKELAKTKDMLHGKV